MSHKTFFALVDDLLAVERLSAEGVSKAIKMDLMLGYRTKYFDIYAGGRSSDSDIGGVIEKLELRCPRPQTCHSDGMLIITLTPVLEITPDQLMS